MTDTAQLPRYRRKMDEAVAVLERLARIDALEPGRASRVRVLGELRELVREAEAWARLEGDERAHSAIARVREEAEGMN